jgi:hypothetical protein
MGLLEHRGFKGLLVPQVRTELRGLPDHKEARETQDRQDLLVLLDLKVFKVKLALQDQQDLREQQVRILRFPARPARLDQQVWARSLSISRRM